MRRPFARIMLFAVLGVSRVLYCQDQRIPLAVTDTVEAQILVDTAAYPAKCNSDQDVYVRFFDGRVLPPTKVSADGRKATAFGLEGTRYDHHARIWDFSPASGGGIHELIFYRIKDEEGYRLLTFSADRALEHDVPLDIAFGAQHLAVFGNGDFLIEGRAAVPGRGGHAGHPVLVIVNSRGQVVRKLKPEGDLQLPKRTSTKSPDEPDSAEGEFNRSINLSTAFSGDDGKVYVIRESATGPLFAISADGTVRTIQLPRYNDAIITTALVAKGRVLLRYATPQDLGEGGRRKIGLGFYSLYDLASLEKIAEYGVDLTSPIRNSIPACYDSSQLTFLNIDTRRRHPVLFTAKPQ